MDGAKIQIRSVDEPGLEKIDSIGVGKYVDYRSGDFVAETLSPSSIFSPMGRRKRRMISV